MSYRSLGANIHRGFNLFLPGPTLNVFTQPPLFVAVAGSGAQRVMTSPDGINWTLRNAAAANTWKAVAYSPPLGLYCAVASDGVGNGIMTSPDGINWTSRAPAIDRDLESICWNGVLFVVGQQSGVASQRIMTSPDGIIWTARNAAFGANWNSVASNGIVTVATALSATPIHVQFSLDFGVTWTGSADPAVSASFKGACWGGTNFISVESGAIGNTNAITSPDGQVWTERPGLGFAQSWSGITMGLVAGIRRAVAVAIAPAGGLQVMTSDDQGLTWNGFAASINNTWNGIAWNGTLFAAVASVGASTRVMTSPDGQVWTTRLSAADNAWNGICSNQSLF